MSGTLTEENNNKLAMAVGLYALGEFTLGEGAEYANVSRQRFRDVLVASSVETRIGPKTRSEAKREVEQALDI